MYKRIISFFLALSICFALTVSAFAADYYSCPDCGTELVETHMSMLYGTLNVDVYYCSGCTTTGLSGTSVGTWYVYSDVLGLQLLGDADSDLISEYYDSAYNGTGGTFETTTDDDGNTTTDYVANETDGTWYVTSDGQIQGKFVSYYVLHYTSSYLTNGYAEFYKTGSSTSYLYSTQSISFRYNVSVPYSGDYTYSFGDFGVFITKVTDNSFYSFSLSDCYLDSFSIPTSIGATGSTVSYTAVFYQDTTLDSYTFYNAGAYPLIQVWSPILYLTYDPTAYGFISNDYSSVTVNGDVITGDSIYYYDYTSNYSNVSSSNYTGAYYVYDSSDSGNYTVYNTDSSGDVVSSYYYDNSTGDTITYMTIYESDTFTDDEMYPSDTGDDDSTSSDSSGNAWTELFSDLFSGIADFLAAIISGVLELLIALVDELVSAVTSLLDTVTNLFTSVLDFGGEFSGFIGSFFDWMPDEIVVLLQLSIALPLLLMVIKFLINLFV